MHKPLKILVVRFSSIGDIVLTTPVVRTIKEQIGAEVHYLTLSLYKNIVRNNPYIDKFILYIRKNVYKHHRHVFGCFGSAGRCETTFTAGNSMTTRRFPDRPLIQNQISHIAKTIEFD